MLREIVELLGTPDAASLAVIQDPRAVAFLGRIEESEGCSFTEL